MDGVQQLTCECGHRGVLYTAADYRPLHQGMRVGGFINRAPGAPSLSDLHCGACDRQGRVRAI